MSLITLTVLLAVSYGAYNFCIKISSSHIHQILGAVILQSVALAGGLVALVFLKIKNYPVPSTYEGVEYSVSAGIFVGLAEILSFYYFSFGTTASRGIPVIVGGSVVVGAFLGFVFLREKFGIGDCLGISLIIAGIVLLTMKGNTY